MLPNLDKLKVNSLDDTGKYESTKQEIIDMAIKPIYNPEVRKFILEARDKHYQIIANPLEFALPQQQQSKRKVPLFGTQRAKMTIAFH